MPAAFSGIFIFLLALAPCGPAIANEDSPLSLPTAQGVSVHLQSTFIPQGYFPFAPAPGDPANGNGQSTETWTITGYFGVRPWEGGEFYFNPETFHGFLLRDFSPRDVAVAASVGNGEAQKGGRWDVDAYVARLFYSHTIGFGGEQETVKDDLNQVAGKKDVSRLTLTFGKVAANDFFDTNAYAHDNRTQFMNWSIYEAGAFDYTADVKGYTVGAIADFNQKDWAVRAGYFLMPVRPNALALDTDIFQHGGVIVELEKRYELLSKAGKLRLGAWENTGILGNYAEAVAISPSAANIEATQRLRTKVGYYVNIEQAITENLGAFFRYSWNDGKTELCCFTDINESVSGGFSIKGSYWGRPSDTVGIAAAFNEISPAFRSFLAAGGRGLLIGNGALPSYAGEEVFETYYSFAVTGNLTISADYQFIGNSAYFADRSPVNMFSGRLHLQF
ncbi:MAG TPA: carbohydrate porin [Hyphomicrobiales bacterium]|nr:carbohydrate porin [Hyphomicrobiales bacterium]